MKKLTLTTLSLTVLISVISATSLKAATVTAEHVSEALRLKTEAEAAMGAAKTEMDAAETAMNNAKTTHDNAKKDYAAKKKTHSNRKNAHNQLSKEHAKLAKSLSKSAGSDTGTGTAPAPTPAPIPGVRCPAGTTSNDQLSGNPCPDPAMPCIDSGTGSCVAAL